jgi:hypothetical protein
MQSGPPSGGDDLLGMEIDFDAHLGELEEIDPDSVSVERTQHAETLIRVSCRAAKGVSLSVAADAVLSAWKGRLRYGYKEAHHLRLAEHRADLRFVTQIDPHGFFVTASVTVLPAGV